MVVTLYCPARSEASLASSWRASMIGFRSRSASDQAERNSSYDSRALPTSPACACVRASQAGGSHRPCDTRSPRVNSLMNAGDHPRRGRLHHRSDLAAVVDDHQPLQDDDAGAGLEARASRAIGIHLIRAETRPIRNDTRDGALHVVHLLDVSAAIVGAMDDTDHSSVRFYSNRFPTAVAQPVPTTLPLTSRTLISDLEAKSSPPAKSSKAAVIFCEPRRTPPVL